VPYILTLGYVPTYYTHAPYALHMCATCVYSHTTRVPDVCTLYLYMCATYTYTICLYICATDTGIETNMNQAIEIDHTQITLNEKAWRTFSSISH